MTCGGGGCGRKWSPAQCCRPFATATERVKTYFATPDANSLQAIALAMANEAQGRVHHRLTPKPQGILLSEVPDQSVEILFLNYYFF